MAQIPTKSAEWLESPAEEEGLRRYVETIRERLPLVGVAVAVTTLVAILYVLTAPKTYEARADLLVTPVSGDDPVARSLPVIVESADPTRDVETASQFVTNIDVAGRVAEDGDSESPRDLLDKVSAEPVASSNIIAITAEGDSPEAARDLANDFADATVEDRTAQIHDSIEVLLPPLEQQLEDTDQIVVREELGSDVARLQALLVAPAPDIRVETKADLPTSQASPQVMLSIFGGILAGLVLGIAGAFAAQNLDPRLRRETQLRRTYRLPILARIPKETGSPSNAPLGPDRLSRVGAEAYRTLRSTLEASRRGDEGSRVILVTGPSPSEGKSTTAVNLASSLAISGKRVILIEADLRRPAVAKALGAQPTKGGVVSVLLGETNLEDALTVPPGFGENLECLLADTSDDGWIVELFSIPAARTMIEDARGLADYVIIDSPPLNEVVDAMPLARQADDVLIVVRLGKTRLQRIGQLGELLAENGVRPVGFAVVGVPRPGRGEYHYYQSGPTAAKKPRSLFRTTSGTTRPTRAQARSRRRAPRKSQSRND
jgi:polysaccharide biosynthesis transport protein